MWETRHRSHFETPDLYLYHTEGLNSQYNLSLQPDTLTPFASPSTVTSDALENWNGWRFRPVCLLGSSSSARVNVFISLKNWWLYFFTETSVTQRHYVVSRNTTVKLAAVNKRHRRGKQRAGCFTTLLRGSSKLTPWYLFCLNT